MSELHSVLLVAVMALVTALLRFLPFWTFGGKRQTPAVISYLGKVLPGDNIFLVRNHQYSL